MADDIGDPIEDSDLVNNIIPDDRFTLTVKQIYERELARGATPIKAAKQAGISARLHNKWLDEYDSFKAFIAEQIQLRVSGISEVMYEAFQKLSGNEDEDPKVVLDMSMKLMKNIDEDFGKGKSEITVTKKEEKLPNISKDDDIQSVIKAAEKAANSNPKEGK